MRMKLLGLLTAGLLLTNCGWMSLPKENIERLNKSALYDPSSVTLIKGKPYHFEEGELVGRGQRFHSHYSYMRAIIIGGK